MDAEPTPAPQSSFSPRILLCEDSPIERQALAHYLRRRGYEVDETADGKGTIEHLKRREINAVLLDLMMPNGDGFDVLTYLQEHRRGLPVILLSGMPLDEIQHKMHRLPKHELPTLLLKPIDTEQVLSMLELKLSGEIPEFETPDGSPPGRAG